MRGHGACNRTRTGYLRADLRDLQRRRTVRKCRRSQPGSNAGINGAVVNGTTRPVGTAPVNNSIPGQFGVSSNASNIGFRGSEDLGGGLKAIFQLESSLNLEAGNGGLGSRNSNVGLTGNWGTIFYGLWDTPYKSVTGARVDPFYATSAPASTACTVRPATTSAPSGSRPRRHRLRSAPIPTTRRAFDRGQTNSVQYWTPNFAGFYGRLALLPRRDQAELLSRPATRFPSPSIRGCWSVSATYDNGPIFASIGVRAAQRLFRHPRVSPAPTTRPATRRATGVERPWPGVQNVLGGLRLYGVYERLSYKTDGVVTRGQLTDFRRDAFGLWGPMRSAPGPCAAAGCARMIPRAARSGAVCVDCGSRRGQVQHRDELQLFQADARLRLLDPAGERCVRPLQVGLELRVRFLQRCLDDRYRRLAGGGWPRNPPHVLNTCLGRIQSKGLPERWDSNEPFRSARSRRLTPRAARSRREGAGGLGGDQGCSAVVAAGRTAACLDRRGAGTDAHQPAPVGAFGKRTRGREPCSEAWPGTASSTYRLSSDASSPGHLERVAAGLRARWYAVEWTDSGGSFEAPFRDLAQGAPSPELDAPAQLSHEGRRPHR